MSQPPEDGHPPHSSGGLIGQVLDGRYQVESLLGQGGMSEVYLARHLRMGRPCALKVMHPARAADPDTAARFEREASAASRIAHPHVCRVYDFGVTPDGLPYLAMEYLEGRTLAAALHGGPLPVARALRLAQQCAAGLQAVHDAGIIHRDLKADNIMLVSREGEEQAVLLDFGIARPAEGRGVTRDGLMVGTPEVMSPEQIAGDPVDTRSDQYQLALLLCRMLTGSLPFAGATTQETMTRRLTAAPTPLGALAPTVRFPPGLQAVLDRALARRPDLRYPTVREMAAALEGAPLDGTDAPTQVLERGGSGVGTPIPPTRVTARVRPPNLARWVGGGALLTLALVLWLGQGNEPTPAPPEAGPDSTVASAPLPAVVPGAVPTPAPATTSAAPGLPAEDSVYSADAAVRNRARRAAETVYGSSAVADTLRAEAAFLVAATYLAEQLPATARLWLVRCLDLQERAGCRRLLSELP